MTSLQAVNLYQLVQAAMKIEKSETKSQERNRERKFSRGGSSSGKRTGESQVDSVQGYDTRGRRQGPTMTQVPVEAFQRNKMKDLNARTITKNNMVFANE